jgi:2-C-methyl-D-erythritol 4-phosphate cytidylyltransferase
MATWAIVVAGGRGERFGERKQYLRLGSQRVLDWALRAAAPHVDGVVLVVPPDAVGDLEPLADVIVAGGDTRSASVRAGLAAVPGDADVIVVHDAARPVPVPDVWVRVLAAVDAGADAAVPAVPVSDTLREVGGSTVDRARFVAVQTPQAFRGPALRAAHEGAPQGTDDASLVEATGGRVVVVEGDAINIKITTPHDLRVAELLCR